MTSNPPFGPNSTSVREQSKDSILFIRAVSCNRDGTNRREETASGFIVTSAGHVITTAHVLPAQTQDVEISILAYLGPQETTGFQLNLIKCDKELDVALFQLPPSRIWKPLTLTSSANVPDDASLFVLGFPLSQNLSSAQGQISNRYGLRGRFQTTLPLNPGYSGSPVFDISGRVVGVAVGGFDQAQQITFVIPSDFLQPILLLSGVELRKDTTPSAQAYNPVYPLFIPIHRAAPRLGSALSSAELSDDTYQAVYEHAHIIWVKPLLTIFVLPRNPERKVVRQQDSHWTTDQDLFNDDKLKVMFGAPKDKLPPHGGVAYHWRSDPDSWKWIGWREWYCRFFNEIYYQEFENGIVFGIFHISPTRDEGQIFVIFNDGSWFSRMALAKAPKCRAIGEPFPIS